MYIVAASRASHWAGAGTPLRAEVLVLLLLLLVRALVLFLLFLLFFSSDLDFVLYFLVCSSFSLLVSVSCNVICTVIL